MTTGVGWQGYHLSCGSQVDYQAAYKRVVNLGKRKDK